MTAREASTPRARLTVSVTGRLSTLELAAELLGAFAAAAELDALECDQLTSAVIEACKNVVYHAYDGLEGPLELELRLYEALIEAVVRDRGMGIRPMIGERTLPHTGIGMPIIHAAADRVLYTNLAEGGTEVRMYFGAVPDMLLAPDPGPAASGTPHIEATPLELGAAAASALARHLLAELGADASFAAAAAAEAKTLATGMGEDGLWLMGASGADGPLLQIGSSGEGVPALELRLQPPQA